MPSARQVSPEEAAAAALEVLPAIPPAVDGSPGSHLPDDLVDTLDKTFRRLRRAIVRPVSGLVPVPALGRQLDVAKVHAVDAVAELALTQDTVTVKDVATFLDLEHSTVSRLLGEVEDDGLLVRGTDPTDRRRTTVELTELGRAVVADATVKTRFFARLILDDWSLDDVEALTRLMTRLAETMQAKLGSLPERAMQEYHRHHPEAAVPGPADAGCSGGAGVTPPSARRR